MSLGLLISLLILSVTLIVICVIFLDWSEWIDYILVLGIIATIVFGIMLYGYAACDWKEVIVEKYNNVIVTKSKNRVFVEYDMTDIGFNNKGVKIFNTKEDYDKITDSTQFYVYKGINHYGTIFEARLGFGDNLDTIKLGVPITTPILIEEKYDSNGGVQTNYNSN